MHPEHTRKDDPIEELQMICLIDHNQIVREDAKFARLRRDEFAEGNLESFYI